jgi:hypothetical protein
VLFRVKAEFKRDVNATELRFQCDTDCVNRGGRNERKVLAVMKINFRGGEVDLRCWEDKTSGW